MTVLIIVTDRMSPRVRRGGTRSRTESEVIRPREVDSPVGERDTIAVPVEFEGSSPDSPGPDGPVDGSLHTAYRIRRGIFSRSIEREVGDIRPRNRPGANGGFTHADRSVFDPVPSDV